MTVPDLPPPCPHKYYTRKPIVVSGIGYSEYELRFCKACDRLVWKQVRTREGDHV